MTVERQGSPPLQTRLELAVASRSAASAASKRTVIGRSTYGGRTFAAVGSPVAAAGRETFPTGCVTKLLVAALLERKLAVHGLDHDVPARWVIDIPRPWILGQTTLRHLLEHRHGLDDSDIARPPRRADGRICLDQLLAHLHGRRVAAPGKRYSYSNAGAWILAAILETLDGRRFGEQLREALLEPLGIEPRHRRAASRVAEGNICPAMGGGLALSVDDLLTFLEACAPAAGARSGTSDARGDGQPGGAGRSEATVCPRGEGRCSATAAACIGRSRQPMGGDPGGRRRKAEAVAAADTEPPPTSMGTNGLRRPSEPNDLHRPSDPNGLRRPSEPNDLRRPSEPIDLPWPSGPTAPRWPSDTRRRCGPSDTRSSSGSSGPSGPSGRGGPSGAPRPPAGVTPLPGWHPVERGVRLGWKCYDGGWVGHQSTWPEASLLLRARPRDGSAVVVASEGAHAAVVAAKVLGRELPELGTLALPRRLPAGASARLDLAAYCGRYALAAETLEIEHDGAELSLRSRHRRVRLIPAADDIFFLAAGDSERSFVQLIDRRRGAFQGLWDGRRVFPLARGPEPPNR